MHEPGAQDLLFVPLGGSGEIGMNFNMYGHDGRWLIVDCGIAFTQDNGKTEVIMPDPKFAAQRRDSLEGIVITHAHEDHLGAVVHLWKQMRCPVYATPFAAAVLRAKLVEAKLDNDVPLIVVDREALLELGPFSMQFVDVTHSTIECQAILITTPVGTVLHTGDFKLDDAPGLGPTTDLAAIEAAAERGILAVVCDSTNATKETATRSEGELRKALIERLDAVGPVRIAVACFSSNIARIDALIKIAERLDRHPILLGRSLVRMVQSARSTGYLPEFPTEVSPQEFGYLPPSKTMLICTGTQGEPGSAMDRIARGDHRQIVLDRGDVVLFSSKIIPGNEASIERVHGQLGGHGVSVVSEKDAFVHVSGHPGRPELRRLYALARPSVVVPVHGEDRHMVAHAELATSMKIPSVVPSNGAVVRLAPGPPQIVDTVEAGRLSVPQRSRRNDRRPRPS